MYQQIKIATNNTLTSNNKKTFKRAIISLVLEEEIPKQSKKELKNLLMKLPALSPTCINASKLIEISYFINLTYDIEGPSFDTDLKIPLVIGNQLNIFCYKLGRLIFKKI